MTTILAYTSPARGHLYPMMDLLLELRRRGHRVVVQTLADAEAEVTAAGLEHRAISPEIERLDLRDHEGKNPIEQIKIAFDTWLRRAPHEVVDLEVATSAVEPDFLLIDANTFGAAAFAEANGLPWANHMPYCLPTPSADAPAFGPGFEPPNGFLGRLRDGIVRGLFARMTRSEMARLNAFRTTHGVGEFGSHADIFESPPTVLYRTAEPFEYSRRDWPANIVAIGPGLWAPTGEKPAWLDDLASPRVLVTISTESQKDGAIIETALAALSDSVGSVICTTSAEDPEAFQTDRDNVRVRRFLPHAEVMPHVDCVVTHGGMGTVQRALSLGKPLCVVPWGRDQSETAQRVVEAKAGVRLNPSKLDVKRLRAAVEEAFDKVDGAQAVAEGFEKAGGAMRGADVVEAALGASPTNSRQIA